MRIHWGSILARRLLALSVGYCFLLSSVSWGWWETGHQVVARIAAAHLNLAARARVARILEVPDTAEAVSDALARAATWADEIKNDNNTGSWHYIDLTIQDHKWDIPERCKDDNCAPARIRLFAKQLASRHGGSGPTDGDALRYVVHFVADVHQPLHAISDADLGGNCERLAPPLGKAKNLHALWDGEIIDEMASSDRELATMLETDIDGLGRRAREIAQGNVNDWVWESHEIAINDIYRPLRIPLEPVEFPASCKDAPLGIAELRVHIQPWYVEEMKPVVRSQLVKAGLRLARLLNETL